MKTGANGEQAARFPMVGSMADSLRFCVGGPGSEKTRDRTPMPQAYGPGRKPEGTPGAGVSVCLPCRDAVALYREFAGNGMWWNPDGYRLDSESPMDAREEAEFSE